MSSYTKLKNFGRYVLWENKVENVQHMQLYPVYLKQQKMFFGNKHTKERKEETMFFS